MSKPKFTPPSVNLYGDSPEQEGKTQKTDIQPTAESEKRDRFTFFIMPEYDEYVQRVSYWDRLDLGKALEQIIEEYRQNHPMDSVPDDRKRKRRRGI